MTSTEPTASSHRLFAVFATIMALFLTACGVAPPIGEAVPVAAGSDFMTSLRTADRLMVHEGLPHQTKERELLERESARANIDRMRGFPFYSPAVAAKQPDAVRAVLGNPRNYGVYSGPKTCGGFHPDYAISWRSGGTSYHALICYGCGEVLFSDGQRSLPYDLKHGPLAELQSALLGHALHRPAPRR